MSDVSASGKTVRLCGKTRGKLYVLNDETLAVLRRALGKNIDDRGTMKNECGAHNDAKNLMGTYMLQVTAGKETVLVIFYRTISSREDFELQLKIGGLKGLLEHAASVIYRETNYCGHRDTGKRLKNALLNGFSPGTWLLISDKHEPETHLPLRQVYTSDGRQGVGIFYHNPQSLNSRAAAQLRRGPFRLKMPNGVDCTITRGDDRTYLLEFDVKGTNIAAEYGRKAKLGKMLAGLLSNAAPTDNLKNLSIAGRLYLPNDERAWTIRASIEKNVSPNIQALLAQIVSPADCERRPLQQAP